MICSNIALFVGSVLTLKIGPRAVILIGWALIMCAVIVGSVVRTFPMFLVCYGAGFGFGVGIQYFAAVISAWSYFPNHKGRVSGIIFGAFGMGSAIFNLVATKIVNPLDAEP
jgi:MFS family permease